MAALVLAPLLQVRAVGAVAQLGERRNRTAEVVSSNLIGSTTLRSSSSGWLAIKA